MSKRELVVRGSKKRFNGDASIAGGAAELRDGRTLLGYATCKHVVSAVPCIQVASNACCVGCAVHTYSKHCFVFYVLTGALK